MIARRSVQLCAFLLVGCNVLSHQPTFDPATREAVRRALPSNITLETIAWRPSVEEIITVEHVLLQVGAHVDEKGTLRDSSGKEIRLIREGRPFGTPPPPRPLSPEELREQAEWEKIRKECTVIYITWNPNLEPFPP